ncbi:GSH2 Glutathione synthetase GSH2 [Candida maltosa Xu316]|uniref:Glutathione synthetase n=1 Tax=Candida maltosa (strain Xu316) TaxID=1245528 RepID=M3J7T1_CANMX|nr:Glutathione synthetase, putative [Candida maltosa Xu316]
MSAKPFPQLSTEQEKELTTNLLQWTLGNGLVMYPPNFETYQANTAPITLFPTPIPKTSFIRAQEVQKLFNELYINVITKDKNWFLSILEDLSKHDADFTGKLFEVYKKSTKLQPLSLGLFRSDYMVHQDTNEIKQIEFNTVSVSFGGLSTKIGQLHQYLNGTGQYDDKYNYKYYDDDDEIPVSTSITDLAQGLADGNLHYHNGENKKSTVVLFIVQPNERNCFDQRHIEYALFNNHGIRSVRLTLEEVGENVTVSQDKLYIKSTMDEVSVVYYRSGYAPSDYDINPEKTWDARLLLENTLAIKCPSVLTQLSGTKKVQQLLTKKDVVSKFLPNASEEELSKILSTFVAIYSLDEADDDSKQAIELAFQTPEKFVLKPQREGGGNNIYKENIPPFLEKLDKKDWGAYILMELINPPLHKNKIIRNNEIYHEDIISELGVFGTTLFNEETGEILTNKNAGWLLRSKFSTSNEGGVAAGFGCVDNIYLY